MVFCVLKKFCTVELLPDLPDDKPDNRIPKVCRGLAETDEQVILGDKGYRNSV